MKEENTLPLFIDLTDTYNQWENGSYPNRPNDNLQGVSPSVIWDIATTSKRWDTGPLDEQCRPKIVPYSGTTGWIGDFDYWFGIPHNSQMP